MEFPVAKLLEELERALCDIRDEDYKLRERAFEVFELLQSHIKSDSPKDCYICRDASFDGLPRCYKCRHCSGHVAADSQECSDCGKHQGCEDCGEMVWRCRCLGKQSNSTQPTPGQSGDWTCDWVLAVKDCPNITNHFYGGLLWGHGGSDCLHLSNYMGWEEVGDFQPGQRNRNPAEAYTRYDSPRGYMLLIRKSI